MPIVSRFLRKYNRQLVVKTHLAADVAAGASVISVVDSSDMSTGSVVVIPLATGTRFWTTAVSFTGNDVMLADALPTSPNPAAGEGVAILMWGPANVREVFEDSLGRQHYRDYKTTKTEAEVAADMNARDQTETLKERDFDEVLSWVLAGNDPNTFNYLNRDVNKNKAEERITKIFARSNGEDARGLAWWIDSLGTPRWSAITTRLGWDTSRSDRVEAKALTLNAATDAYDASENV